MNAVQAHPTHVWELPKHEDPHDVVDVHRGDVDRVLEVAVSLCCPPKHTLSEGQSFMLVGHRHDSASKGNLRLMPQRSNNCACRKEFTGSVCMNG